MTTDRQRLIRLVQSRPLLWKYKEVYDADYFKATNKLWTTISKRLGMQGKYHTFLKRDKSGKYTNVREE